MSDAPGREMIRDTFDPILKGRCDMKAAYIEQTGTPEMIRFGDLPDPVCGPGDVLVRVRASSVNPIDTYIRAGVVGMASKFPYIPGCDVAGTVESVGPQVTRFKKGDRVWGSNQSLFGRPGACAELLAVDEGWLYPTPEKQTDECAAAGALVGLTACLGLFEFAKLKPGEWIFVNGGSGGVGSAVIQLAKSAGAYVMTTAGSEENVQYCRDIGADVAISYRDDKVDDQIKTAAQANGGLNVWWETQREPNFDRMAGLMKNRGRMIVMAGRAARPEFPVGPFYTRDLSLLGFAMFNASQDEQRAAAERMNAAFAAGRWTPRIGARFPLSELAAAHRLQEDNTLAGKNTLSGKIVISV
ncbi:NADPH:quinone reductase [Caulifigura coniformis]|uniref:NADPH:quinone reductase n=1 Tax=Caulifigura coniformis TaxID=2527983 RepID=UPI001E2F76C2|nr:NADPH:quinone reductase [Caulifigura coniformis]